MPNNTQLERYKKLLSFIDEHLKEEINIEKIEEVCHYSYRNINRIFQALHHETIGKYIKRLRLEKAAQYLKYSAMSVSDIGYEVGFEDRAAFSKAFKSKYGNSPSAYRIDSEVVLEEIKQALILDEGEERQPLQFKVEYLPDFEYIFLEYRGAYENILGVEKVWEQLFDYTEEKKLFSREPLFMTEIIDDTEVSDHLHFRYHLAFLLEKPLHVKPDGLFRTKIHKRQRYAKFVHRGSHESSFDFYNKIYAFWMLDVSLELVDLPTIEFYPNFDQNITPEEMITEIYIPVK